ncbi:toxic anion resistance protein [Bacillus swezeyi]|uniref:Toxic anion resistance protein n=1 Tax=Bacillus swezeyi TaxID=1925020 RepID=A0A5M8R9Y7_9BACI|nr:toxic anion resistance protein [Bacillus swezeyi]KAA6443734.1 toxic anion resistance protein [Bacillus swezeyi]TYS31857.1 toxic anion resistance protein [Bacillus swezeyi]
MSESKLSLQKTEAGFEFDDLLSDPFGQASEKGEEQTKLIDVLTEENRRHAFQLAERIDPKNHQSMTLYGIQAQSKLLDFSHAMLEHVQKKDISEIGEVLSDLMKKFEEVSPDELQAEKKNVFSRFFKVSHSVQEVLSRYQKTGAQIDRISVKLEHSKDALINDNKMFDQLYEKNKEYFEALNVYIAAAQLKVDELHTKTIPQLKVKIKTAVHNPMAVQDVNDLIQFADQLEKRVYDLNLSRQMTMQSAPQIRLIQNTNQVLIEKIQSSIMTVIPLWKNQVSIAIALLRQRRAVKAQKQISDTTNKLLLKNAEMMKVNTVEIVKENERGFIDIETLKNGQDSLIGTLEETLKIQEEGRVKRLQAKEELRAMEDDLKVKLLNIKENQS